MSGRLDDLAKLGELRDKGILTEAEFQAKKAQLLAQPLPRPAGAPVYTAVSLAPKPRRRGRKILLGFILLFGVIGIAGAIAGQESSNTPGKSNGDENTKRTTTAVDRPIELCAALRDPQNAIFGVGDFADLFGVSKGFIRQYVVENCPGLIARVS